MIVTERNPGNDRNLAWDAEHDEDLIRVGAGSDPQAVAAAISNAFYENQDVTMRAAGAAAVNQAVKAIAISRGYIATRGMDLICRPGFTNVSASDGERQISAIVFRLSLL